jgi:hypothetical protein
MKLFINYNQNNPNQIQTKDENYLLKNIKIFSDFYATCVFAMRF